MSGIEVILGRDEARGDIAGLAALVEVNRLVVSSLRALPWRRLNSFVSEALGERVGDRREQVIGLLAPSVRLPQAGKAG